jgi:hypothetical protein
MTDEQLDEEMLRDLQKRTAQLPREIAPPEGAWSGIATQMEIESRAPRTSVRGGRAFWQKPGFLAAAALLLVAASSITTALVIVRNEADGWQGTTALHVANPSSPATLAEFTARENDYIAMVNALSTTIENPRLELAPETLEKLKESVRIIDAAILEARRALAEDPSNKALMEMLSTSYSQKVDLLRRTAEMGES